MARYKEAAERWAEYKKQYCALGYETMRLKDYPLLDEKLKLFGFSEESMEIIEDSLYRLPKEYADILAGEMLSNLAKYEDIPKIRPEIEIKTEAELILENYMNNHCNDSTGEKNAQLLHEAVQMMKKCRIKKRVQLLINEILSSSDDTRQLIDYLNRQPDSDDNQLVCEVLRIKGEECCLPSGEVYSPMVPWNKRERLFLKTTHVEFF